MEEIIKLISAFGIGSILSAIFAFIQSNKRNQLDYITKERSEWRREMKSIIADLLDGRNRRNAISRLKAQLNPYGRTLQLDKNNYYDYYMKDGHLWDLLERFDYSRNHVNKLIQYLELLLKYDWERSKGETKAEYSDFIFKFVNSIILVFLICAFLFFKMEYYSGFNLWFSIPAVPIVFILCPYLIVNQWKYLENVVKSRINNKKCTKLYNEVRILLPLLCSIFHVWILGNQLNGRWLTVDVDSYFVIRRLSLLIFVILVAWFHQYINQNYMTAEEIYINNILKKEQN